MKKSEVKLPPGLLFGINNNPDGKNNYTDPTNESKPIFLLDVNMDDDRLTGI